jgi:TolA-binding protein
MFAIVAAWLMVISPADGVTVEELANSFVRANGLMKVGDLKGAAAEYLRIADAAPQWEFADKALNNAAVCFENLGQFDAALRMYERMIREHPTSPLADSALFRIAVNAENTYDFDKAIQHYRKLVSDYPSSTDRENAQFNVARLLESLARYHEAADEHRRYASLYPQSPDAPKELFRAAVIFEKNNDPAGALAALNDFLARYGRDADQVELIVQAKKGIGAAHRAMGHNTEARTAYEAAANDFDGRRVDPRAAPLAADAAAEARLELADLRVAELEKQMFDANGKLLVGSPKRTYSALMTVNALYSDVLRYDRPQWTLTALYRRAQSSELFLQGLRHAPPQPKNERGVLESDIAPMRNIAIGQYRDVLKEAEKQGLRTEWVGRVREGLERLGAPRDSLPDRPLGDFPDFMLEK